MFKDVILPILVCLILSVLVGTIVFSLDKKAEASTPEFKIFSVCLEGKKFAVAMTISPDSRSTGSISITSILISDGGIGSGLQEECKK
jgi:hypothetical protein